MRTAAVGLWLTGLAAAGTAVLLALAPSAMPAHAAPSAAWRCDTRGGIGEAERLTYQLKVNSESVDRAVLKPRDWLRTDTYGAADICLALGRTTCRIGSDAVARVLPAKGVLLYVSQAAQRVSCKTASGGRKRVMTPQATILVDDPAFSIAVRPKRTLVRVDYGAAVVGRPARMSKAVVVARKQQAVVRAGHDPQQPTRITTGLWRAGKGTFRIKGMYSSATVRDGTAGPGPTTTIVSGPSDPSSSPTATFEFTASKRGSIMSCALDGGGFYYCTSPQRYEQLLPGRHRLLVRSTSPAGNTGDSATYSWTILP